MPLLKSATSECSNTIGKGIGSNGPLQCKKDGCKEALSRHKSYEVPNSQWYRLIRAAHCILLLFSLPTIVLSQALGRIGLGN